MRCVMCGRAIFTAAVSIPTRNGPVGYGPVCAKKAGLGGVGIGGKAKAALRAGKRRSQRQLDDQMQLDLLQPGFLC